ncbi:hypothetical protein REPUB_Repub17cG0084000 [Reevesia pubescens]
MTFYSVEDENDAYYEWSSATCLGDLDRLKELAEKKAKESGEGDLAKTIASFKGKNGRSIFHFAALAGRERICKYLVEELKLNVDDFINDEGLTPLHSAILGDQHFLAVYLLDNGANPNSADNSGNTPFHFVAKIGSQKLLEYFISKGAEIDAKSDTGTPLQLAASVSRKDIMKVLLDNHANPNVSSHGLWSPMISSIGNGSIECVNLLLQAGADPNFVSQGDTPLVIAAATGETEIIKCLLNAGADPNVPNHVGHVPIEVAASLDKPEAVMTETLEKNFLRSKSKGEEAFKRKDYREAINCYTEALTYCPPDPATIYSNRSLCWARLNRGDYALEDAQSCLRRRPNWPKAYYRKYMNAADAFYNGWKLDLRNKELEHAFMQAIEAQREQST